MESTERRRELRIKKRISCELNLGEKRFSGLVLDVSLHGLFVQTAARSEPRQVVQVSLSVPGSREPLRIEAVVVRARLVPPELRRVAQGGLGLHVPEPTEAFRRFVENVQAPAKIEKVSILPGGAKPDEKKLTREQLDRFFAKSLRKLLHTPRGAAPPAVQPQEPERPAADDLPRWRVELSHVSAGSHRSLRLRGASESQVRQQVEAEIEPQWKIERIERV